MSLEGWDAKKFTKQFGRQVYNSVRRAAKLTGADVIAEFRDDGLDGSGKRRRQKVNFKVRKNNTLAFIDRGIDARVREYGATIRAKAGRSLKIVIDDNLRERDRRDLAKGRSRETFVIDGKSGPVLMQRVGKQAKPIAVLKRKVVRKPISRNDRLSAISDRNVKKYEKRIQEILEGS